ncbi:ATP-dependent DNA helicase [Quillaja saponaria]|uniref:ATP-dependent DNA helicase n=1 Tax=Quillaja saponaria TaxID=32244 RepID=A0AAD7PI72_QUISA|nr:ATP-dependent DNA helicase [Quillaja saponaria]
MVQLMKSESFRRDFETASCDDKVPVKLEIEDPLEEEHGPLSKRSKRISTFQEVCNQQWSAGTNAFLDPPSQYNPLNEPSPLGLRLRKSPSLLDLIQMKLSQSNMSTALVPQSENLSSEVKKESRAAAAVLGSTEKLKASNFPASHLRIGCWEYKSRYEGDLVAKCYFAKHKLVWEVLEGGLKSKIEIQWSDIMALSANCPDNGPGTLTIVLGKQPLFFRETNPQPRKHTLWQATGDFTNGEASTHRQHFLQCPQGLLNKHFEKLIQCDMRLNFLSRQPEIVLDSPYFESQPSAFEDPNKPRDYDLGQVKNIKGPATSGLLNVESPSTTQSSSLILEHHDHVGVTLESQSREATSPSSVMDTRAIDGSGSSEIVDSKMPRNWEQIKLPGLHPSMSMSDFMSQIGHCISEQMTSGNPPFSDGSPECKDILEDIAQYLLSDNQFTTASDEKSLMSRVNSLCCLLQKDQTSIQNSQIDGDITIESNDGNDVRANHIPDSFQNNKKRPDVKAPEEDTKDVSCSKKVSGMSRKDSFGELLLHLPRIASLPKFLFNISEEDGDSQRR